MLFRSQNFDFQIAFKYAICKFEAELKNNYYVKNRFPFGLFIGKRKERWVVSFVYKCLNLIG